MMDISEGPPTYKSQSRCKRGHRALRYVKSNGCVECVRLRSRAVTQAKAQKKNAPLDVLHLTADWTVI